MVTLTINGKIVTAEPGEMLLPVIRRQKIDIPALCHHEAVEPFGACRLCMVEITKDSWDGWTNHVTACLYPVEEGLIVLTHAPKIIELRKTLLDLHLARNPHTPLIQRMAAEYGLTKTSFETVAEPDDCILCGICTRVCDEMGFHAISTVNRGHGKEIAPPLHEPPPDCVGCLACAHSCPTDYIKYEKDNDQLTIWKRTFELTHDKNTGEPGITKEFAKYLTEHREIRAEYFETSDESDRTQLAQTMGRMAQWEREVES